MRRQEDFSQIAPVYRWLEYLVFGNALQKRRVALLHLLKHSERVLVLGDGDGRFTAEYLRLRPNSKLDFVDISPGMVRLASKRVNPPGIGPAALAFHIKDARSMVFAGPYDLVVTPFFLDCFSTCELITLLPRIAAATTAQAQWLISEFGLPRGKALRACARVFIRTMYLFFRWTAGLRPTELPDYAGVLSACGFRSQIREERLGGLLLSELWSKTTP